MAAHIALLRAVNVVGRNKVAMKDLVALVSELGFAEAKTLLQSGNLVFQGGRATPRKLEALLEGALRERLALNIDFFVRTASEWDAAVAANPFPREAARDPGHLLVMFLKAAPDRAQAAALVQAIVGRERVHVEGRHAYLVYPDGVGGSRLTSNLVERKLGTRGTARNWNTVLKLQALCRA